LHKTIQKHLQYSVYDLFLNSKI